MSNVIDFDPMKTVNEYWGDKMPMKKEGKSILIISEEMAELIQAISKFERHLGDKDFSETKVHYRQAIITEMADVYIACAALCDRYSIEPADIGEAVYRKLDKKY